MSEIVELNYVNEIKNRILPYYIESHPSVVTRYEIIGEQLQQVEQVFNRFLTVSLQNAIGVGLDLIGKLLDSERGTLSDDEYRVVLRNKLALSRASGSRESVMSLMAVLTGGEDVKVFDHYPASMNTYCGQGESGELFSAYSKLLPAGVNGHLVFGEEGKTFVPSERNYIIRDFVTGDGDNLELEPTLQTLELVSVSGSIAKEESLLPERGEVTTYKLAERYSERFTYSPTPTPEIDLPSDLGSFGEQPSYSADLETFSFGTVQEINLGDFS